jgi:hypothetical protein
MNKKIAVISSYSTDRLIEAKTGVVLKEQSGGPALFITKALTKMNVDATVYAGEPLLVEMAIHEDEEYGIIRQQSTPQSFPLPNTDVTIFSTILREWTLDNIHNYKGKIFLDIQGYVRDGSDFGKKQIWKDAGQYADAIFCLKGNEVEMQYIPVDVLHKQKQQRMVITTLDREGVQIDYKGKSTKVTPKEVIKPPNTIGAGDTFFANFVGKFVQTGDLEYSANHALLQTSEYLRNL